MRPLNYDKLRASERAVYELLRGRAQHMPTREITSRLGRWHHTSIKHATYRLADSGVIERAVVRTRQGQRVRAEWGCRLARHTIAPRVGGVL